MWGNGETSLMFFVTAKLYANIFVPSQPCIFFCVSVNPVCASGTSDQLIQQVLQQT